MESTFIGINLGLSPLIASDPDLSDFFLANGGYSETKYDLLSYMTDDKKTEDSEPYRGQPDVQDSETHGHIEFLLKGNCFSNAPETSSNYVKRPDLEDELHGLLMDRRHPVVTLQGAGGAGKTSSTLQVIDELYKESRFDIIVWFSSRDIDLLSSRPRTVRPAVMSPKDIAKQYVSLVLPKGHEGKGFNRRTYFQEQLGKSDEGPTLFVFDNFETVQNPVEMFTWIESFINLPNKVLITTRLRDFRGDYPLEVHGMEEPEARTLIEQTAKYLGIRNLLDESSISKLIEQSGGHPYVMKILLGEMAVTKNFGAIWRVVAGREEILTALFERTYEALSPCGQRAFLTLAAWNSAVPRIALQAVLIHSTKELSEVEKGIESLLQYSLAEIGSSSDENQEFIHLPLAASEFGKKKLGVHVLKSAIWADVRILQMFTPARISDVNLDLNKGLNGFIRNLSNQIDNGGNFAEYEPILSMICRAYNPGWLLLAQWRLERGNPCDIEVARSNITSFLEKDPNGPESPKAWKLRADASARQNDNLGEVHAYVERAQIESVPFHDVSNAANLLNRGYDSLDLPPDGKRELAKQLLDVMEERQKEAGADDLSRMAWLALHLNKTSKARSFATLGLEIEPENIHCSRILDRLDNMAYMH